MKKIMIVLGVSTLVASAFANETTTERKDEKTVTAKEESEAVKKASTPIFYNSIGKSFFDGIKMSAAATLGTFKAEGAQDSSGFNGFGLAIGKEFELGTMVTTTTEIGFNTYSFGDDAKIGSSDFSGLDTSAKDYGLSQRVSLVREKNGAILKPYIGLGFYMGNQNHEGSFDFGGIESQVNVDIDYIRTSYFLGVEAELNNGVTPYFRFERSDIQTEDKVVLEASSPGLETTSTDTIDKVRLSANTFTLGLGYSF